ncbi:NAD(P)-dependent oxidoreductase [Bradyrhizobium sp. SZCCHNS1054]|uniref:NAD(P)-dependent oxidoreductase n=1 Tax=Bradyrhizobium sp. SZCCHNS1054 TaxID=3057301 RepID=UPI0029162DAE|nr:NAD(P)-dependent oxidoreductase [Bradyrhizobium sp. SZCCHNS1054]
MQNFFGLRRGLPPTHLLNIEKPRGIDIEGHLSVLRSLVGETKNPDNTHSVILQHILPTTVEYIDLVHSVYPVDLVIAITYSADQATVELLRKKGYEVYVPASIDEMLNDVWKLVAQKLEKNPYPLVLQEVGGYFANWTNELGAYKNFKGCVEDTANGLWRYEAAAKKKPLGVPVISMADTPLKHVEDALIGDACVYSLEKVMRSQMASILQGLRCGVVGWGHIGKSAAAAFAGRHASVSIYDINPVVTMLAYAQGYYPMPLSQLLAGVDVVMGCSGRRSIRVADIDDLKDGIILCSASSKDIEFDLAGFAGLCDIEDIAVSAPSRCAIQKYTRRETGKCFYILDHGTPIDFLDMPLQGAILDCTCSELFTCMRELSSNKHEPGVIPLTDDLQIAVSKKWLQIHSQTFAMPGAEKDKVFFYPDSWNWQ